MTVSGADNSGIPPQVSGIPPKTDNTKQNSKPAVQNPIAKVVKEVKLDASTESSSKKISKAKEEKNSKTEATIAKKTLLSTDLAPSSLAEAIHKSDQVSSIDLESSSFVNSNHGLVAKKLSSPATPPNLDEITVNIMTSGVVQSLSSQHLNKASSSRPIPSEVPNYSKKGDRYNTPEGQEAFIKEYRESRIFKNLYSKLGEAKANEMLQKSVPTTGEKLVIKGGVDQASSELSSFLNDKGVLGFAIRTVSEDGKHRGPISGKVLFDEMMSFHGDSIKAIEGNWSYETNLKIFNSEVDIREEHFHQEKQRAPDENELNVIYQAAAKVTWTGSQAAKFGFSHVKSVTFENGDRRSGVTVLFTRD